MSEEPEPTEDESASRALSDLLKRSLSADARDAPDLLEIGRAHV